MLPERYRPHKLSISEEIPMFSNKVTAYHPLPETEMPGNSYFGNLYMLHSEQYGLEHLDRHNRPAADKDDSDIEAVAILGYN